MVHASIKYWKPILCIVLAFLFLIIFVPAAAIIAFVPTTEVENANEYKDISKLINSSWADMIVFDTVRYENDFSLANPEDTAWEFILIEYKLQEFVKSNDGPYWATVETGVLNNKKDILNFCSSNLRSYPKNFSNAVNIFKKNHEYVFSKYSHAVGHYTSHRYLFSIKSKTLDTVMQEHNFTDVQIEWAIALIENDIVLEIFGDEEDYNYNIPVFNGSFTREDVIIVAKSILGHPYLYGGKSPYYGKPKNGLDCSGYVDWVFYQLTGQTIGQGGGTAYQYYNTLPIRRSELMIGDLGFYYPPNQVPSGKYNHVGIYIGTVDGKDVFIHAGGPYWGNSSSPSGRVVMSYNHPGEKYNGENPSDFKYFRRINFEFENNFEAEDYED